MRVDVSEANAPTEFTDERDRTKLKTFQSTESRSTNQCQSTMEVGEGTSSIGLT
ncbi:MAG TPA: hypothetical protein V6D14_04050 [Coleofasciculaceae cyanobacterium]